MGERDFIDLQKEVRNNINKLVIWSATGGFLVGVMVCSLLYIFVRS